MPGAISRLESPSHPMAMTLQDGTRRSTLSPREAALDRDFVLSVEAEGLDAPQAWIERDDDGGRRGRRGVRPEARSGDGAGRRHVSRRSVRLDGGHVDRRSPQRAAALPALDDPRLPFNIVGFGSTTRRCFPKAALTTRRASPRRARMSARLEADLGGTEILPALEVRARAAASPELPRQVVVLTDGEVTNTDAVLALAQAARGDTRVSSRSASAPAPAITSSRGSRGPAAARRSSSFRASGSSRRSCASSADCCRRRSPTSASRGARSTSTPAPSTMPPVFAGGRAARVRVREGSVDGRRTAVRLTRDMPVGPARVRRRARSVAQPSTGRTVATLAARARIRELEESPAWMSARGSRSADRKASGVRQEIVELAMRYGLMSRETSFVAIERRETPVVGRHAASTRADRADRRAGEVWRAASPRTRDASWVNHGYVGRCAALAGKCRRSGRWR